MAKETNFTAAWRKKGCPHAKASRVEISEDAASKRGSGEKKEGGSARCIKSAEKEKRLRSGGIRLKILASKK